MFLDEIRHASRRLLRAPALTAAVVLCTALGIGAVSAAFSTVQAVLLRPLPYRDPGRLVMAWERALAGGTEGADRIVASFPNYLDWREGSRSLERMAAYSIWFPSVTGGDQPEKLLGAVVTADFFPALGVQPLYGRTFLPEEDRPGGSAAAVLSHGLWLRRYGGDPSAVGKTILLDGAPHTIVGILPASFRQPEPFYLQATTEVWKPLAGDAETLPRGQRFLRVIARIAPQASLASASAELDGIARRLEREHPDEDQGMGTLLVPLHEQIVGDVRPALLLLLAAAGLVLLIACANVSSLLLAKAAGRSREMAVRAALGASRSRLSAQVLAESLLLALAGGALGLMLGAWGARALLALTPQRVPRAEEILAGSGIQGGVLAFALGACALTALLSGLAPALRASASDPGETLQESGPRGTGGRRGGRLLALLVVLELALSLPLLIGAGLLARSLAGLEAVPSGLRPEGVLTLRFELPGTRYAGPPELRGFYERLLARLAAEPGVRAAGTTSSLPLSGLYDITLGAAIDGSEPSIEAGYRAVSPGFFEALGIPIVAGRPLSERDTDGSPAVALVNQEFARTAWPGQDPLGRMLTLSTSSGAASREIVGVVGNVAHEGPASGSRPEVFVPVLQSPLRFAALTVQSGGDPAAVAPRIREALREIDPDLALADVQPMDRLMAAALAAPRFRLILAGLLAAVALALAALGLYGLTSYSVGLRAREIGVRAALGAQRRSIFAVVLGRSLALALAGVALGLAGALALTRLLASLLYGVGVTDPAIFVLAPLALLAVALAAAVFPARRAARVDPIVALRAE